MEMAPIPIDAPRDSVPSETVPDVNGAATQTAYGAVLSRFEARNPKSFTLFKEASDSLPGGNTRTQLHTNPFPVFMKSGKNYQVFSEDGHTYTDLVGELTAGIYGHSHPVIIEAIKHVLVDAGLTLGANTAGATPCQGDLYKIQPRQTGARAYTSKRKVVAFGGGYHGGVLSFSGGKPASNCVDLDDWIVAKYNDIESTTAAIKAEGVAAVLVEGMQGACGAVPGKSEFLKAVESVAREVGVVFILDEVMTSRVAPGGLTSLYDLKPDMKTFGKYLGGGMSFGGFGGHAEIMAVYDPRSDGALSHHGTFNNNTLSMNFGYTGMTQIYTPEVCIEFNTVGERLRTRLAEVTKGTKMCFTGVGTILCSHFSKTGQQTVLNEDDIQEIWQLKDLFWYEMMEVGFGVVRRGSISVILGSPQEELDRFVVCVEAFLKRHADIVRI